MRTRRLKIFTWHIHGSYLYYLSQGDFDLYIPFHPSGTNRNIGRGETFPFGSNVIEVSVEEIPSLSFDCILYQHRDNYLVDQYAILTEEQRRLPRIFLEHDPPREHPTDMAHVVNDPDVLIVHVTHFNQLMWNNNGMRSIVVEHGVVDPQVTYSGELARGIVVINDLPTRGRLLGSDIFRQVAAQVPLDLVGMNTEEWGLGEVLHPQLPAFISRYRFFFNPIRYTSFGLAVIEAMLIGLPVVGMATTEMPAVFNVSNGIVHNNIDYLISRMKALIDDPSLAVTIGKSGQETARSRFNIQRFTRDWENVFRSAVKNKHYETTNSIHQ